MLEPRDRIIVTGAGGMVGSHVVDRLRARPGFHPDHVIGLTRSMCDLRDFAATRKLFQRIKPTQIFHPAACVYGIMGNMRFPGQSYVENTQINTSVIDAASRAGCKKITVMGTGCMYPFPPISLPMKEEHIFMGRPHPSEAGYAHAKLGMMAMLEAYSDKLDWACIVSCNLFGPRDKFDAENGHVVPALIRKFYEAKRDGTTVTVWGDGSPQRDFIYIEDCARAVELIMDSGHGPINMGTNHIWSIEEIIRVVTKISGLPKERIVWDTSKPNGVDYRGYDLSRLDSLGFKPQWSIARGLLETWDWYCHERTKK